MDETTPIYNSSNYKQYFEYTDRFYPHIDKDDILRFAGMTLPEVNDPGHWFCQKQSDLFYQRLAQKTENPTLARDVGRYTAFSDALGPIKQHTLGFVSPGIIFSLMKKLSPRLSRGATLKTRKLNGGSIEIVSRPAPGIIEKPYQCKNRSGIFDSIDKTGRKRQQYHPAQRH